jgi:hypothetical protein
VDGVEILNQTNIYQSEGLLWVFWLIVGIAFALGLIISITEWVRCGFDIGVILCPITTTVIGIIFGIFGYLLTTHDTEELSYTKYQVTVSDEVNFTDFMDKYEILDQEGKIYTVKEREQ